MVFVIAAVVLGGTGYVIGTLQAFATFIAVMRNVRQSRREGAALHHAPVRTIDDLWKIRQSARGGTDGSKNGKQG